MRNYNKEDIISLAHQIYREAGGKKKILAHIRNYKEVSSSIGAIHNYFYVNKNVFDYGDLNATLGLAAIFLHGGKKAQQSGIELVEILCCLAQERYLIDYTFCDKAFDGFAYQLILHVWFELLESNHLKEVCDAPSKKTIEDWLYLRAQYMIRDKDGETWSTFRPYDNQEIGVGACTLAAILFRYRDPELAEAMLALADERLTGWERKNGNLDDTLFYTPILAKVLYFYGMFRPRKELLELENCRQTFEGMLQQQPGSGIFTQYNWTQYGSAPEMMAMGARLFQDGRYKWMANCFLHERLEKRNLRMQYAARNIDEQKTQTHAKVEDAEELEAVVKEELSRQHRYDHVWEGLTDTVFHLWYFWDDELEPHKPKTGSMLLEKHAGQGRWPFDPEPILPDKIIMRGGWEDQDLFAMLNLWGGQNSPSAKTVSHRYPGVNEITALVCGEQFVVSNTDQISRDIHIHRKELNAFNLMENGKWLSAPLVMFNPEGRTFGIYPAIESFNSELRYFTSIDGVDGSKSTMYEYHGWTSERTLIQYHGEILVVFDQSFGPAEAEGGTRWHLQGQVIKESRESRTLQLFDSKMTIYFPHEKEWLQVVETPNKRAIPIYQHHADLDLDLISKGKRMGAITVFCPGETERNVQSVAVTCGGYPAFPNALGIRIGNLLIGSRLGMYRDAYDYEGLKTDAASFIMEEIIDLTKEVTKEETKKETKVRKKITFFDGRQFFLSGDSNYSIEVVDELKSIMILERRKDNIIIRFQKMVSGIIEVKYRD